MKKLNLVLLFICILLYKYNYSQTTIYSQNFGTPPLPVGTFPAGWSSTGATSGWNISAGTPSTGYLGASGGYNVAAPNVTNTLTFSNVSTVGYGNISVLWGAYKPSVGNSLPVFEWSSDSITWTSVTYTGPVLTLAWQLVNGGTGIALPPGAAGVTKLFLRWIYTPLGPISLSPYRIDDVIIQGTPVSTNTPSKLKILSVNYGSNPDSCNNFDVVVQSQDTTGAPANVSSPETVTLAKFTGNGTGILTGGPGTIPANSNLDTINVSYSNTETGVSILASGSSLIADTSNVFNVQPCLPLVPASLPTCYEWQLSGSTLQPYPVGWYNYGLDTSGSSGYSIPYCGVFNTQNDSLLIYFNGQPDSLVFWFRGKALSGAYVFDVLQAGINHVFSSVMSYNMSTAALGPSWNQQSFNLSSSSRYVKFVYTTKVNGNIQIDSICIYPYTPPPAATKLKIVSINNGSNPDSCTAFNVVIQSEDSNNNPANVSSTTMVSLVVNTGNNSFLSGTLSGTIPAGTNNLLLPVNYNAVQNGVSLNVYRNYGDTLSPDTSGFFDVNACYSGIAGNYVLNNITVFPNPANDKIFINNIPEIDLITFADTYGRNVRTIKNSGKISLEVPINDIHDGIYIISFYGLNGNYKKIIFLKSN